MHLLAEPKLSARRLLLLRVGAAALVVLLLTGFWQLQVVRSEYYANLAERNRIRTLPMMAPRGDMEDREGAILVSHYPSYSVILIRDNVEQVKDALPAVAQGIGLPLKKLEALLKEHADAPPYQTIVLKEEALLADIAFIEAHRIDLPELELLRVYRRRYPPAGFAGH
ncbi:MAG: penicillin-binding protein 2, partial [Terriglobia bacterium]